MKSSSSKCPKQQKTEELYSLTNKPLTVPGGQTIQLTDREDCLKIFDCYFPDFTTKLITLPSIDKIDGGLLYGHADRDGNPLKEVSTDINKESGYKGEIMDFYSNCVGKLTVAHGLLIHSYGDKIQKSIFRDSPPKEQFEIDWLYANNDKLVAIEVGRKLSGNNSKAVDNKIEQMATRSAPKLKKIVDSILKDKETTESGEAVSTFNFTIQCLVCLTNISLPELNKVFKNPAKNSIVDKVNENWFFLTKETVDFMKIGEQDKAFIYQIKLGPEGVKKAVSSISLQSFFSNSTERQPVNANDDRKYVNALLATGSLLFDLTKPEVPRFYQEHLKYLEKKHKEQDNSNDSYRTVCKFAKKIGKEQTFVLSPQQLQVLHWNPKKLLIFGEAGCGKTTMLLAKLMLLHEEYKDECDNMEKVLFYIPFEKKLLIDSINSFIEQYCRPGFVKVATKIDDLEIFLRRREQTVVLVDEVHSLSFAGRLQRMSFSTVWICINKKLPEDILPAENFDRIVLKYLFRSASHIAASGTFLLNSFHTSPYNPELFECFASNQTEIEIHKLNSLTSIRKNLKIEKQTVFLVGYDEIEFRNVFGNSVNLITLHFDHIGTEEPVFGDEEYHFTGVEYDQVVLIIGPKCSKFEFRVKKFLMRITGSRFIYFPVDEVKCESLTYQVLTRSVKSFHLIIPECMQEKFGRIDQICSRRFRLFRLFSQENVLTTHHFEMAFTLGWIGFIDIVAKHGSTLNYNYFHRFSHLAPGSLKELLLSMQQVILHIIFSGCKDELGLEVNSSDDGGGILKPVFTTLTDDKVKTILRLCRVFFPRLHSMEKKGNKDGFRRRLKKTIPRPFRWYYLEERHQEGGRKKEELTTIVVDESISQSIDLLYSTEFLGVKSLEELVYALEQDVAFKVLVMNCFNSFGEFLNSGYDPDSFMYCYNMTLIYERELLRTFLYSYSMLLIYERELLGKHFSLIETLSIVGEPKYKLVLHKFLKLIYTSVHPFNPLFGN